MPIWIVLKVYSSSVIRSLGVMISPVWSLRAFWFPAIVVFAVLGLSPGHAGPSGMADSELVIISESGEHRFEIEVARTPDEQARGLMYRQSLPPAAGMLFEYGPPQNIAMWMRNTHIPLDMIFIGADWRITRIAQRTVPLSLTTVASEGAVTAVLEVNAGTASRLGIRPGDRVVYKDGSNFGKPR